MGHHLHRRCSHQRFVDPEKHVFQNQTQFYCQKDFTSICLTSIIKESLRIVFKSSTTVNLISISSTIPLQLQQIMTIEPKISTILKTNFPSTNQYLSYAVFALGVIASITFLEFSEPGRLADDYWRFLSEAVCCLSIILTFVFDAVFYNKSGLAGVLHMVQSNTWSLTGMIFDIPFLLVSSYFLAFIHVVHCK